MAKDDKKTQGEQAAEAAGAGAPQGGSQVDDDGIQRYEGTISKFDKDGNEVLSDHVGPGERLTREVHAETADELARERAARLDTGGSTPRPDTTKQSH